jgi:hypothetical protein
MFITRVTCDASRPGTDIPPCAYLDVLADKPEDIPTAFTATLTEAGWSTSDDGYYCRRHNPTLTGLPIVLGDDYIEPVPGLRIRLTEPEMRIRAELLLDPTRYRVTRDGGLWEATHANEHQPT